jgi:acid phosphatase type 7
VTLFLAATLAAVSAGAAPAVGSTPFTNGPYLQNLASSSVEVRVELDAPAAANLEILDGAGKKRTIPGSSATFHVFRADGLAPQTSYRYIVRAGAFESPLGQFVTAPPDDSRAPFAFIVYGDNRSNDQAHAAVVRAIQQQSFDFLVNSGDFVAAGGERAQWHAFFAVEADLLRDHCVFACVGNHELVEDQAATNFLAYFGARATTDAGQVDLYSSFRWANARFFLLNAFQDWGQGELSWLRRELEKADAEPGVSTRVVVVHRSPWSSGHHGDDVKALAAGVPELLVRHHVDLVFAGHDHMYERGEWMGLKYVTSGGGGAPLDPDITPKPSTRRAEATYNFVRVSVEGDDVKVVAQRPDGSTIESCGFRHGASWDCDGDASSSPRAPLAPPSASQVPSSVSEAKPGQAASGSATPSRCACDVAGARSAPGAWALLLGALGLAARRRRPRPLGD